MCPDSTTPRYYVYILARPDGSPFYVGKGQGKRAFQHDYEARNGCPCHKCSVIRKVWRQGGEIQRYIVFTTNNEAEALAYEIEMIALHGPHTLTNKTVGGDGTSGYVHSDETRKKIRAMALQRPPMSVETRAKIGAAFKGKKLSPERIEQRRIAANRPDVIERNRAAHKTPEAIARIRAAHTPEMMENLRKSRIGKKASAETRERQRLAHLGKKESDETRERKRAANIAAWERKRSVK